MRRCASCLIRFEPKATGRPPRYCSNACRQAGFRRVTKLKPRGVEAILLEHGMDGESLCGLVASCLRSELARHGATLPPERFDDTLEHLIVVALTIAEKYDPARSGPGYTFSSYLWDMLKVRLIDYWRREIGDTRRRPDLAEMFAQFTRPLSWEALTRDADVGPPAADELDDDMHEAVEALAGGLSDEARETLATIVRPLAEGWRIKELASELGTSSVVVNARLRRMREELERLDAA